jgi:hypothetical protein
MNGRYRGKYGQGLTKEIKGRRARSIIRVNGKLKEKGG